MLRYSNKPRLWWMQPDNQKLTAANSLQGGLPFSISMMVQPKLHMSTAKARSGLASFRSTACMTCMKEKKNYRNNYKPFTNLQVTSTRYLWSHPVWTALQWKITCLSCKLNKKQELKYWNKKVKEIQQQQWLKIGNNIYN